MKEKAIVERILSLSSKAASEKDRKRFISLLEERGYLLDKILGKDLGLNVDTLVAWLEKEQDVLTRLEEERKNVLKEMDNLSKRRMAARRYAPKFPFPPMPVFFDRLE